MRIVLDVMKQHLSLSCRYELPSLCFSIHTTFHEYSEDQKIRIHVSDAFYLQRRKARSSDSVVEPFGHVFAEESATIGYVL